MSATSDNGWTLKSIVMATAVSLALMFIVVQLAEAGVHEFGLEGVLLPALGGAIFLGLRHRGTWLLSLLLFLPLMAFVLFMAAISMAGEGNDL